MAGTAGNLVDIHLGYRTVRSGTVAVIDKVRLVHCCIGRRTVIQQLAVVARSIDLPFLSSSEARNLFKRIIENKKTSYKIRITW